APDMMASAGRVSLFSLGERVRAKSRRPRRAPPPPSWLWHSRNRDLGELRLDRGTVRLLPRRKLERGPELRRRLIDRETRADRGDLVEDGAGLAEVDRGEVLAVQNTG